MNLREIDIDEDVCGVYMIVNKMTDEAYIGASATDLRKRMFSHNSSMKKGVFCYQSFNDAWQQEAIGFDVLEECSPEVVTEREDYWIEYMKRADFKVVNQQPAGKIPYNSPEAKARKSLAQRGARNGNARLTQKQVDTIRKLYDEGINVHDLHNRIGVTEGHIRSICKGLSWSDC